MRFLDDGSVGLKRGEGKCDEDMTLDGRRDQKSGTLRREGPR